MFSLDLGAAGLERRARRSDAATHEDRAHAGYVALLCLPDPIQPWAYFALATYLLSFPYAHAAQVSWTSRNAGSVATRTVSASCVQLSFSPAYLDLPNGPRLTLSDSVYNMAVQVSAIIGANRTSLFAAVLPSVPRAARLTLPHQQYTRSRTHRGTRRPTRASSASSASTWPSFVRPSSSLSRSPVSL